jgi:hypothetical protein
VPQDLRLAARAGSLGDADQDGGGFGRIGCIAGSHRSAVRADSAATPRFVGSAAPIDRSSRAAVYGMTARGLTREDFETSRD